MPPPSDLVDAGADEAELGGPGAWSKRDLLWTRELKRRRQLRVSHQGLFDEYTYVPFSPASVHIDSGHQDRLHDSMDDDLKNKYYLKSDRFVKLLAMVVAPGVLN